MRTSIILGLVNLNIHTFKIMSAKLSGSLMEDSQDLLPLGSGKLLIPK